MEALQVLCLAGLSLLLLPVIFFFLVIWQWKHPRIYWKLSALPSTSSIPIFGDTISLAGSNIPEIWEMFLQNQQEKKYRYFQSVLLGIPSAVLYHPDDIEVILGNMVNIDKGYVYDPLKPWLNEGLLLSTGAKWRERRKLLTPAFHFQILEENLRQISDHSKVFVKKLLAYEGKPISVESLIKKYTLDVICETAMGIKMNTQDNDSVSYLEAIKSAAETSVQRMIQIWLLREWIYKLTAPGKIFFKAVDTLHRFSEKIIKERREERIKDRDKERKRKRYALLDVLLETDEKNPGTFTPLDIQEEVDTFMFEGHDTTSSAINFSLYCLATNPDVQEQVLEEQERIFGGEDREITMQDLQEMTYLDMVIKEVLRLYPPVPYISRTLSKDTTLDGKTLAAGTEVVILPYALHRHYEFWEDPEEFRPERFLPGTSRHPFCYIPFSAGPRNCIGMKFAMMELKITLSTIARNCHVEPITLKPQIFPVLILGTEKPIQIKVTARKK